MNRKIILLAIFTIPLALSASVGEAETSKYFLQTGREYDLKPRIVDFVIFVGLMYYLLAGPISNFFTGRRDGVAEQLNEIETRLQDAKNEKKEAQMALEQSKVKSKEIIDDAKKEANLIGKKAADKLANDLTVVQSQHDEKLAFQERKMAKETIDSVLSSNISSEDIPLSENQVIDILSKKVA